MNALPRVEIPPGAGSFLFDPSPDGRHLPLTVHSYRPHPLPQDAPLIFVMHGLLRDGERYRDRWRNHAQQHGFLLLAPEFDQEFYPATEAYNLGGVVDSESSPDFNAEEDWAFHRIEDLFETVRRSLSLATPRFGIYGHSAGAQFVHRLVLFHPEARFKTALAANAGWYTLPCQETSFPYGLAEAPVCDHRLAKALQRRLVILLGEDDTNQAHPNLRRTPEALDQGQNRFQRGHCFLEIGRRAAERLGVPFEWRLATVPDAAHHDRHMSQAALDFLLDGAPGRN